MRESLAQATSAVRDDESEPSRWQRGALGTLLLSIALSLPVTIPALRHLNAPWGASDMTAYYFLTDTWDWWKHGFTENAAFPFGMDSNVYAGLDGLTHVVAAAIAGVTGSPFIGLNLLLLASFPVVALLAFAAIRLVGLSGPLSVVLASAFTFIPFHFGRGIGHIHLGMMFGLVTGVILALLIGSGRLARWFDSPTQRQFWGRLALMFGLVITTSWTGLYYAFFGIALSLAAVVWRLAQADKSRALLPGVLAVLSQIVAVVIGLVPVLISRANAPSAGIVGLRDPLDSVTYAGNLAISLIPQPYSVLFPSYNAFVEGLFAGAPLNEAHLMANYGTWVTSLAVVAFLVGLLTYQRRRSVQVPSPNVNGVEPGPTASITLVGYLTIVVVVLFVPWSVNYLFASLVTAQIRAWNRLEPYLLLLFILGAAAALAQWKWVKKPLWVWLVSTALVAVIALEMVLPWRNLYVVLPEAGQEKIDSLNTYANSVSEALPNDCGILTLPFIDYPNAGPLVFMDDYDHFLIGMTNQGNPISYGAYRGSQEAAAIAGWSESFSGDKLWELRQQGFCGIHVDSAGYEDAGPVLSELEMTVGPPVAQLGRWTMFSLN